MSDCSNSQDSEAGSCSGEEMDEDEILATLSAEELKQLQSDMEDLEPDLHVPLGHRQRDHTGKTPTGSFDHRSLVEYLHWEKESNRLLEEERVPATLLDGEQNVVKKLNGTQSEKDSEGGRNESEAESSDEGETNSENLPGNSQQIQQLDNGEPESKNVTYKSEREKELVETMNEQQSKELLPNEPGLKLEGESCDPQNVVEEIVADQPQDEQEKIEEAIPLCNKPDPISSTEDQDTVNDSKEEIKEELPIPTLLKEDQENTEATKGKLKAGKKLEMDSSFLKLSARPSGNPTHLDDALANIRINKPDVKEVNLNNVENIPKEMLKSFVEALKKNKHVTLFSITNTGADDNIAFAIANMLRENKRMVTLNIESNFISGKGIVAILRCLQFNEVLTELRFHNQRHMLGHHAEMEIARLLKANSTLLKLGYHFELPGPRMVVTNLLSRNLDQQRQLRNLKQQRNQFAQEQEVMVNACRKISPDTLAMLDAYMPSFSTICEDHPFPPPIALHRSPSTAQRVQLRKVTKKQSKKKANQDRVDGNETPNLRAMIRSLKPVPRARQAPVAESTPRDDLLSDIRQSNVAFLKSVPLPKLLD
ncbi:leiomodin-3 [Amblyraja radiata]|uniref:leiomodin-3 n=1 Tax=Amblyraja radiata TaxID=386614 RepID=UPI0014030898|nr:leiomodin-3 [Amblyraja radiata]